MIEVKPKVIRTMYEMIIYQNDDEKIMINAYNVLIKRTIFCCIEI